MAANLKNLLTKGSVYVIIKMGGYVSEVGRIIKEKRKSMGLSQKKLSIACQVSDSEIYRIESGCRQSPSWEILCRISRALNLHPFDLLLEAGYITQEDINPVTSLHGLEKLNSDDIQYLQLFIDFMLSRKTDVILEGG